MFVQELVEGFMNSYYFPIRMTKMCLSISALCLLVDISHAESIDEDLCTAADEIAGQDDEIGMLALALCGGTGRFCMEELGNTQNNCGRADHLEGEGPLERGCRIYFCDPHSKHYGETVCKATGPNARCYNLGQTASCEDGTKTVTCTILPPGESDLWICKWKYHF